MDIQSHLLRERKALLDQWRYVPEKDRPHLIVRIMDIDEQLERARAKKGLKRPGYFI